MSIPTDADRLIRHVAVLNLAIDGDQVMRNYANESWASLPDSLVDAIEKAEEDLKQELTNEAGDKESDQ